MSKAEAFVYILASGKNGTIYTGVTSNLEQRLAQHKAGTFAGFTSKYDVSRLVWLSDSTDIENAIALEKKIKNRGRAYKISLIEKSNPNWNELFLDSAIPSGAAE